jgi:hypothetical protein
MPCRHQCFLCHDKSILCKFPAPARDSRVPLTSHRTGIAGDVRRRHQVTTGVLARPIINRCRSRRRRVSERAILLVVAQACREERVTRGNDRDPSQRPQHDEAEGRPG